MRVAPLGAYYFGNPARAAAEAAAQAEVTHANIEGIAGAVAVAVAASTPQTGRALFDAVLDLTPGTYVRKGLRRARTLSGSTIEQAAAVLGNGSRISAQDTVPFALWAAARYHRDYPAAIRACVRAGGDMDTTAAITGGIVATQTGPEGIPSTWLLTRETPSRLDRLTPARLPKSADAQNSHSRTLRPTAAITARTYRSAGIGASGRLTAITVCGVPGSEARSIAGSERVSPGCPDRSADARSDGHVPGPGVPATGKRWSRRKPASALPSRLP